MRWLWNIFCLSPQLWVSCIPPLVPKIFYFSPWGHPEVFRSLPSAPHSWNGTYSWRWLKVQTIPEAFLGLTEGVLLCPTDQRSPEAPGVSWRSCTFCFFVSLLSVSVDTKSTSHRILALQRPASQPLVKGVEGKRGREMRSFSPLPRNPEFSLFLPHLESLVF